jgi:hypothetical protein
MFQIISWVKGIGGKLFEIAAIGAALEALRKVFQGAWDKHEVKESNDSAVTQENLDDSVTSKAERDWNQEKPPGSGSS